MAYYIINGNYNNYKLLTYIPFNTEKLALKYCDKNGIITSSTTPTIHYKYDTLPVDSNGTIFIYICNHLFLESLNEDMAVTKKKSYRCNYFDNDNQKWIKIKTPILARKKTSSEIQLKVSPLEYQLFSNEFNRYWNKNTKLKIKSNGPFFTKS
ncbi:hypothetical protein C9J21_19985 [Photobacterium phosphoreum]|uniref:hypothetical protein n=1 Tax=Photobacterium phosphoreum TaxID=659 RepID=UPI000D1513A5|nr:hypothetical protein [Photobacterium phosphoreum]PSW29169.1 hypothetical protein C9J21_19985 [Photobacterium phosphoreum]